MDFTINCISVSDITETIINENYGFIYVTRNNINQKIYVGQKKFRRGWKTYLGSGKVFCKSLLKNGREHFTRFIIEICKESNIDTREKFWISELDSMNPKIGYNMCEGGGSPRGMIISKETREKQSIVQKMRYKTTDAIEKISGENNNSSKYIICKDVNGEVFFEGKVGARKLIEMGFNNNQVYKCMRGETRSHRGYFFTERNMDTPFVTTRKVPIKYIVGVNIQGDICFEGRFGKVAIREMGFVTSSVYHCVNGKLKSHRGMVFIEKKNEDDDISKQIETCLNNYHTDKDILKSVKHGVELILNDTQRFSKMTEYNYNQMKHIKCCDSHGNVIFNCKMGRSSLESLGFSPSNVYGCINGKMESHLGFTFEEMIQPS